MATDSAKQQTSTLIQNQANSSPGNMIKITIPTGRIQEKVLKLLNQVGMEFRATNRSYRPACTDEQMEAKYLKAQNIPGLIALGRHDCGFTGHDWITEQEADVVELLDLGFDPVRIVAAMPEQLGDFSSLQNRKSDRPLVVASQYCRLASRFIKKWNLNAVFVQAYGATEAMPPEDADIIIDNVS